MSLQIYYTAIKDVILKKPLVFPLQHYLSSIFVVILSDRIKSNMQPVNIFTIEKFW